MAEIMVESNASPLLSHAYSEQRIVSSAGKPLVTDRHHVVSRSSQEVLVA